MQTYNLCCQIVQGSLIVDDIVSKLQPFDAGRLLGDDVAYFSFIHAVASYDAFSLGIFIAIYH